MGCSGASLCHIQGNILEGLAYPDGRFDIVYCSHVFGHLPPSDLPLQVAGRDTTDPEARRHPTHTRRGGPAVLPSERGPRAARLRHYRGRDTADAARRGEVRRDGACLVRGDSVRNARVKVI